MPIEFDPSKSERSFFEAVKEEALRLFQDDEQKLSRLHQLLKQDNEISDLLHASSVVGHSSENFLFLRSMLRLQSDAAYAQGEISAMLKIICETDLNLQRDQLVQFKVVLDQLAPSLTKLTDPDLGLPGSEAVLREIRKILNGSVEMIAKIVNEISTLVLRNQVQPIKNLLKTEALGVELGKLNTYANAKNAYEKSQKHWQMTEIIKKTNSQILALFSNELCSESSFKETRSDKYIACKAIVAACFVYQKENQWINLEEAIITAKSKIVDEGERKAFDAGLNEINRHEEFSSKSQSLGEKIEELIANAKKEMEEPKMLALPRPKSLRRTSSPAPAPSPSPSPSPTPSSHSPSSSGGFLPYFRRLSSSLSSFTPESGIQGSAIQEEEEEFEEKKESRKEEKEGKGEASIPAKTPKTPAKSKRTSFSFRINPPT